MVSTACSVAGGCKLYCAAAGSWDVEASANLETDIRSTAACCIQCSARSKCLKPTAFQDPVTIWLMVTAATRTPSSTTQLCPPAHL
jgi:hypothetical protein